MNESIIVAIIGGLCTAIPSLIATIVVNQKTMAVNEYRINSLEEKMDKHNNVIERVYKLEEDQKNAQYRINDLKNDIDSIRNN
jgi:peptidoglycan hydrolase CwlO-like protein